MRVLAIETSSFVGSVALLENSAPAVEKVFGEHSRHGRDLLPCVDAVLGENRAVDLVAVSAGPGSYTGLRVGITFVKTFCIQSHTPAVSVSSLDAIAENITEPKPLCVVVDARLGRVYAAVYDAKRQKILTDSIAKPAEIAAKLAPGTMVVGSGLAKYREMFSDCQVLDSQELWQPTAKNVGKLGIEKYRREGGQDPQTLVPVYLGKTEAELKWERSQSAPGQK